MKYYVITYGCQINQSDSERISSVLEKINYKKASSINEADLVLVNMCSVRQSAVDRIHGLSPKFKKLKAKNKRLKIILTGCVLKDDLKKFKKSFDLILDIKDLPKWYQKLHSQTYNHYLEAQPKHQTSFQAFIPISNGCNNFCAYCVVPYARGREVCRDHKEILKEVRSLIKKGFKEIWLLGQNVNSYKSPIDSSINFAKLLKKVGAVPGNFWIRFTSPHPKDFSAELIKVMAKSKKVTDYLNLPIQSGDNTILKKMNRPYTAQKYISLVKKIRKEIPEITLSTDVIVGFPGETKQQFENTVKVFKEVKFDMAYISQYSLRPGTAAAKLKDNVSRKEKYKRWKKLSEILKETALEKNKKYVGKTIEVLIEEIKDNYLIGKTKTYKTVRIKESKNLTGKFVKVKIINALPWSLKGEKV